MEKILALDLGSSSIGATIRDTSDSQNQIKKTIVSTFNKGVGSEKNVEFSFAAERTKHRSLRRLYQARKYKLWETLELLKEHGYCPIQNESLNRWKHYDKTEALRGNGGRKYPIEDLLFNKWIKLDFDNDNKPDYISPYQLRLELITTKLDFTQEINKHKLGRALYHIAQHRGFKSSKKVVNTDADFNPDDLIGAEKKRSKAIGDLLDKHQVKTVGAAFAFEEKLGNRIRKELHKDVLRKQLQDEVKLIFDFQELKLSNVFGLDKNGSERKINQLELFWQRPLRSQKGTIGKCTLETTKYRCPISQPAFEEFRAWSFLNNIQYRLKDDRESNWETIPHDYRVELYNQKFFRVSKADFDFVEIVDWLKNKKGHDNWILNYKDKTNVSACPISARLKDIFGDDLTQVKVEHIANQNRKEKKAYYNIDDIWHVLFSCDDEDFIEDFAINSLHLNEINVKKFIGLWYSMPVGYSMLSLKAINNILYFLRKGLIYTEATLLAKVPEILGSNIWLKNEQLLIESISKVISRNREDKKILNITNNLIAQYKSTPYNEKQAFRDFEYQITDFEKRQISKICIETFGEKTWTEKSEEDKKDVEEKVAKEFQSFFSDNKRTFKKLPHLLDSMKAFLIDNFETLQCTNLNKKEEEKCNCDGCKKVRKLYHPSQIEIYPPAKEKYYEDLGRHLTLLGSPKTGAFKNPMAMRALQELKKLINYLLITEQIDENTRIVVELARELNDANKRWAYETYQKRRQEENKEFAEAILELIKDPEAKGIKLDANSNEDIDKFRLWYEMIEDVEGIEKDKKFIINEKTSRTKKGKKSEEIEVEEFAENNFEKINKSLYFKLKKSKDDVIAKYRLWKEQNCQCIYTGKTIRVTDLFKENLIDFEHTIPRSISFDNRLENLTVCYANYNRNIKKNQIPFNLPNYDVFSNGYDAILPRLEKWKQKVKDLEIHIEFWKTKSKRATDKDNKDFAIRQRHLWQFEMDYWKAKVERFTMKEVKSGFRNSQLVDTQIISKYAFHFLKTLFNKVDVQKGIVTAEFRKIFGVQQLDEKKDRSKHSHHAKDALVLCLIPTASVREQILKYWFEIKEKNNLLKSDTEQHKNELKNEIDNLQGKLNAILKELNLPDVNKLFAKLDEEIIINNLTNDQTLTLTKKKQKIKGKERIATGDSIRGQLHLDTFYGKIKKVKRDENGKPIRDDERNFVFEEKNDGFAFAVRKEVNKDLNIDKIVDPHLKQMIEKQIGSRTLAATLNEDGGLWMLKKDSSKAHKLRHIRCFADDVTEPLQIKPQTNLSKHDYKNFYWAKNGENYCYALYEGVVNKKVERKFLLFNLFKTAILHKHTSANNLDVEQTITCNKKGDKINLVCVLTTGLKVIFYKENIIELKEISKQDLIKRIYKVINFEKDGRIVFGYHLDSRSDNELKALENVYGKSIYNGFSIIDFDNPMPKVKLSVGNLNCVIENVHFLINPDGEIVWKL